MVPVVMGPDDGLDGSAGDVYAILGEDLGDILLDVNVPVVFYEFGIGG